MSCLTETSVRCVCVFMYVECRNIQASAHIKSSVFSSHLQPCLRQGLLLIITHSCEHKSSCHHQHPEDIQRTGILVASPPPPHPTVGTQNYRHATAPGITWVLGTCTQVLTLTQQLFQPLNVSLARRGNFYCLFF